MSRKIHMPDGAVWTYRVGRGDVVIRDPSRRSYIVPCHVLNGRTPAVYERGQWKGTCDGTVRPEHVRRHIESILRVREAFAPSLSNGLGEEK